MKKASVSQINRFIKKANDTGRKVVMHFDEARLEYELGRAKMLNEDKAEPGDYIFKIESEEGGDPEEYIVKIEEREQVKEPVEPEPLTPPARTFEPSGNESVSMLMQMRQMDLESWERERRSMREEINQLREYFNKMLEVEREKYATALKTERDAYEFRLTLLQGNQAKLDEERAAIRETEQKIIKSELTRKMKGSDDDGMSLKDLMTIVAPFLMRSQPAAPQAPTGSTPSDWNQG